MDLRGDSWTCVGIRGPSWACVGFRGHSWTFVGGTCTFVEIRGGFVEIRGLQTLSSMCSIQHSCGIVAIRAWKRRDCPEPWRDARPNHSEPHTTFQVFRATQSKNRKSSGPKQLLLHFCVSPLERHTENKNLLRNYFTLSHPHHNIYTFCYWQNFWHSI